MPFGRTFEYGCAAIASLGEGQLMNVPLAKFPDQIREGDYLRVTVEDGEVIQVGIDREAKARAQAQIQAKLERLRCVDHLRE